MRVTTRWHNDKVARSLEEVAGAMAFSLWKIAVNTVNKMYNAGFNYRSNVQQMAITGEFLIFFIQVTDRLAFEAMEECDRQRFTTEVALRLADIVHENMSDEAGPGEYRAAFIEKLNERAEAYAEFGFADGEPSYPFLRYLGVCVHELMGAENKWIAEHVQEVEAPAALKTVRRAFKNLLEGRKPELEEEGTAPA